MRRTQPASREVPSTLLYFFSENNVYILPYIALKHCILLPTLKPKTLRYFSTVSKPSHSSAQALPQLQNNNGYCRPQYRP